MKYVHDNHIHVYYLSKGFTGYTLKSYTKDCPVSSIQLDERGYKNFMKMLEDGGWYESTRS